MRTQRHSTAPEAGTVVMGPQKQFLSRLGRHFGRRSRMAPLQTHNTETVAATIITADVREVIRTTGQLETVSVTGSRHCTLTRRPYSTASAAALNSQPQAAQQAPAATTTATATSVSPLLPSVAPVVRPMSEEQLSQLVRAIQSSDNVVAITGAGISTEAGIPDYRGPQGAYTRHGFKPMTHQQFMAGPAQRARYFARSFFGWHEFSNSRPAAAHEGLARLVRNNWVSHIITQNVDRLHHKAGTPRERILELHGTTHEVRCLSCGTVVPRKDLQQELAQLNPAAADLAAQLAQQAAAAAAEQQRQWQQRHAGGRASDPEDEAEQDQLLHDRTQLTGPRTQAPTGTSPLIPVRRPDGDVELQDAGQGFVVPPCAHCGGVLKPDVVFFGDNIPKERAERSLDLAAQADMLLVVGSSLMVWSAYRLVETCKRNGGRVVLVNVGTTRADGVADLKLEVLAGEAIMRAATHPALLLPKIGSC